MTGPLKKRTRHSSLSQIKVLLFQGRVLPKGYKAYNNFGSAFHSQIFQGKRGNWKLTIVEKRTIAGMLRSWMNHPIARRLLEECPIREKRQKAKLNGVPIHFTPDASGAKKIIDGKTTACTTFEDFLLSAIEYGYFRQDCTYSTALRKNEYWIIGVGKKKPYTIFPVLTSSYPAERKYAMSELAFLLYIYKHYGNPVIKRS